MFFRFFLRYCILVFVSIKIKFKPIIIRLHFIFLSSLADRGYNVLWRPKVSFLWICSLGILTLTWSPRSQTACSAFCATILGHVVKILLKPMRNTSWSTADQYFTPSTRTKSTQLLLPILWFFQYLLPVYYTFVGLSSSCCGWVSFFGIY